MKTNIIMIVLLALVTALGCAASPTPEPKSAKEKLESCEFDDAEQAITCLRAKSARLEQQNKRLEKIGGCRLHPEAPGCASSPTQGLLPGQAAPVARSQEAFARFVETYWTDDPIKGCRYNYNLWVGNQERGVVMEITGTSLGVCTNGANLVPYWVRDRNGAIRQTLVVPPRGLGSFVALRGVNQQIVAIAYSASGGDSPANPGEIVSKHPFSTMLQYPVQDSGRQLDLRMNVFRDII